MSKVGFQGSIPLMLKELDMDSCYVVALVHESKFQGSIPLRLKEGTGYGFLLCCHTRT